MLGTYGFGWILIGFLAGGLAKLMNGSPRPPDVAAACWGQAGGFIAATIGALLILFVYRLLVRRRY